MKRHLTVVKRPDEFKALFFDSSAASAAEILAVFSKDRGIIDVLWLPELAVPKDETQQEWELLQVAQVRIKIQDIGELRVIKDTWIVYEQDAFERIRLSSIQLMADEHFRSVYQEQ